MKFRTKLLLDRTLAHPFALLLNCIVWPLGKVLHRSHRAAVHDVKTIVCAKIVGIGSIVRATPMIRALKDRYPTAKIVFVTSHKNKVLINHLTCFDQVLYIWDDSAFALLTSTIATVIRLWKLRPDLFFDLEVYSAFSTILATASLARNRYGFYRTSTRFRLGLHTHLVYFNDSKPISEIYLSLAAACGAVSSDIRLDPLVISCDTTSRFASFLKQHNVTSEPLFVINPNASDLMYERRWPLEYFAAVMDALAHQAVRMFIVGSSDERKYTDDLFARLSDNARNITINTAGDLPFGQVLCLLQQASCFLTNDSGLFHVALSLNTPTVSLWGPGNVTHYAVYPYGNHTAINNPAIYCSPCLYRVEFPPCKGNNQCMKSISPRQVYGSVCEFLKISPDDKNTSQFDRIYTEIDERHIDITVHR